MPALRAGLLAACLVASGGLDAPRADAAEPVLTLDQAVAELGDQALHRREGAVARLCQAPPAELARFVPQLSQLVVNGGWFAQSSAAQVLTRLGPVGRPALPALLATAKGALAQRDWDLAQAAMQAATSIQPDAASGLGEPLLALFKSTDESDRYNVLLFARHLGSGVACLVPALVPLSQDPATGENALLALAGMGDGVPGVLPALQQALASPNPVLASAAVKAYAVLGARSAATVPALISALGRDPLRASAMDALCQLGPQVAAPAVPALARLARTVPPEVRGDIGKALARLKTGDLPPVPQLQSVQAVEGRSLTIDLQAEDPDDIPDVLTASIAGQASHGAVVVQGPMQLLYTPAAGYLGEDRLRWSVSDGQKPSEAVALAITVVPDTTPAKLLTAVRQGEDFSTAIHLHFDKPVDAESAQRAGAYTLDAGALVLSAALGSDGASVVLTTSTLAQDHDYQLTLLGIKDRARIPNTMPSTSIAVPGVVPGLHGDYFTTRTDLQGPARHQLDGVINFPNGPVPGANAYSVRWTGLIEPTTSETYTFYTTSDDGSRVAIDDHVIVDNWGDHGPSEKSGTIAFTKGKRYRITVEFYQGGGGQVMSLSWSSPTIAKCIVPATVLWTQP